VTPILFDPFPCSVEQIFGAAMKERLKSLGNGIRPEKPISANRCARSTPNTLLQVHRATCRMGDRQQNSQQTLRTG